MAPDNYRLPNSVRGKQANPATGKTPAMVAGIADHVWSIDEIIALLPEKTGRFQKIGS